MDAQDRRSSAGSLQDHLRAQALGMRLSESDRAALNVLSQVLGAAQTGRLYKALVDAKKTVSASSCLVTSACN